MSTVGVIGVGGIGMVSSVPADGAVEGVGGCCCRNAVLVTGDRSNGGVTLEGGKELRNGTPSFSVSLPVSMAMQSLSLRGLRLTLGEGVCGGAADDDVDEAGDGAMSALALN